MKKYTADERYRSATDMIKGNPGVSVCMTVFCLAVRRRLEKDPTIEIWTHETGERLVIAKGTAGA